MKMMLLHPELPLWKQLLLGFFIGVGVLTTGRRLLGGLKWIGRSIDWLRFGFRVRCDRCRGTGICLNDDGTINYDEEPHSCCSCARGTMLPISEVDSRYRYGADLCKDQVLIGSGWNKGSLWARIWHGGPRKSLGVLHAKDLGC